jgi:hypothetical protein
VCVNGGMFLNGTMKSHYVEGELEYYARSVFGKRVMCDVIR